MASTDDAPENPQPPAAQNVVVLNQLISDEEGVYGVQCCQSSHNCLGIVYDTSDGSLQLTATNDPLPAVEYIWHPTRIDVLILDRKQWYKSHTHEVLYEGQPAIAKNAAFEWEIAPRFLGHLTENGRVMGLLLEKVDGSAASIKDIVSCEQALQKIHSIRLVHGGVNRYNFLVDKQNGRTCMVDFEHAENFGAAEVEKEMESLRLELTEETGRGAPIVW